MVRLIQFKSRLKNEAGFALPAVMVIAAVGVLLTLALSQTLVGGSGMATRRGQIITYETFVENFKHVMEDPAACTAMLRGKQITMGRGAVTDLKSIDHDHDVSTDALSRLWEDPEKTFGLSRLELELLSATAVNTVRPYDPADFNRPVGTPEPPPLLTYPARVMLHPKGAKTDLARETRPAHIAAHQMSFEEVGPLKKHRIDIKIFVNVDSRGVVQNCYGYRSDAALCIAAGGSYDFDGRDTDFPQMKCKPDKRCFTASVGLVEHPSQCPAPYNYRDRRGRYRFANSVGKINGVDKYMCSWCHPF